MKRMRTYAMQPVEEYRYSLVEVLFLGLLLTFLALATAWLAPGAVLQ